MPPKKDTAKNVPQDDYYANISETTVASESEKKPIKIKKKPIIKKVKAPTSESEAEKKPKILAKNQEKTSENSSAFLSKEKKSGEIIKKSSQKKVSSTKKSTEKSENVSSSAKEKPKARLVEREHAGKDLLRSVMAKQPQSSSTSEKNDGKRPLISF